MSEGMSELPESMEVVEESDRRGLVSAIFNLTGSPLPAVLVEAVTAKMQEIDPAYRTLVISVQVPARADFASMDKLALKVLASMMAGYVREASDEIHELSEPYQGVIVFAADASQALVAAMARRYFYSADEMWARVAEIDWTGGNPVFVDLV